MHPEQYSAVILFRIGGGASAGEKEEREFYGRRLVRQEFFGRKIGLTGLIWRDAAGESVGVR